MTSINKACLSCAHYAMLPENRLGLCLLSCKMEVQPYITRPGLALCQVTRPDVYCDEWEEVIREVMVENKTATINGDN